MVAYVSFHPFPPSLHQKTYHLLFTACTSCGKRKKLQAEKLVAYRSNLTAGKPFISIYLSNLVSDYCISHFNLWQAEKSQKAE
jgi:hypothetical protein